MDLGQVTSSTLQHAVYDELFQAIDSRKMALGEQITLK